MVDVHSYMDSLQFIDSKKCKDTIEFAKELNLVEKWSMMSFGLLTFSCCILFVFLSKCILIYLMYTVNPRLFLFMFLFGCLDVIVFFICF